MRISSGRKFPANCKARLRRRRPCGGLAVSPLLTVEEAYLLCKWPRQVDPNAVLSLGYVPMEGSDESFPNGFTIRAEKCPNRRGVENVIAHFGGQVALG